MWRSGMASSFLKAQSLSRPSTCRRKVSPVISGLTSGSRSSGSRSWRLVGAARMTGLVSFGHYGRVRSRRKIRHVGHGGVAECCEFRPVTFRDWIGGGQAEAFEIQELAVLLDAEIEMRAGGEAGHADEADALALLHMLAAANEDAGEMHVVGGVAVGVLDFD